MARTALLGTYLNEIAGSPTRKPRAQVLVLNPRRTSIAKVANGTNTEPWVDLSAFAENVLLNWNVGYENDDNPSVPSAKISFRRSPNCGLNLREGMIQDGVIVQIRVGDDRIRMSDWEPVFTGHFRGTPGNDAGTRADQSEGLTATAYGREENFLKLKVTTEPKPASTDLGEMAFQVATEKMGLTQGELLIGALGVVTLHETNQFVDEPALSALWHCLFPAGKKPMFNGRAQLVAVDFNLDKPAIRIYSEGNFQIRSIRKQPNDLEVNNSVVLVGQNHNMTKLPQEAQQLNEVMPTVGFFEKEYSERHWFSDDRKQRADGTYLVTKTKIKWSNGKWGQVDEFHGRLSIDTHWLQAARIIIFVTWLATQLAVILLDLLMDSGVPGSTPMVTSTGPTTLAILRSILSILSQVAMAFLLWAMQFIGRGRYQIWGKPYENAYQEIKVLAELPGLLPEQVRQAEYRNAFISTMSELRHWAVERLRRELVKNQVYQIELTSDPVLEVDDVLETKEGDRYYILSVTEEFGHRVEGITQLTAWKVYADHLAAARRKPPPAAPAEPVPVLGYGEIYGEIYGEAF